MKNLTFLAKRTDGLGERLRGIINAMALSSIYGGDFKFAWSSNLAKNEWHSTGTVEKIFSKDFIEKFLIGGDKISLFKNVSDFFVGCEGDGLFFCDQSIPHFEKLINNNPKDDYFKYIEERRKAFWRVGFSNQISDAIDLAKSVKLNKNTIALHLRAGDLIYGNFKQNISYIGKAIAYPLAFKIAEDAKQAGFDVLVFGQDKDLMSIFSKKFNAILAPNLIAEEMGVNESAIFDVVLMSRCDKIYAGNSGFSTLSASIGDAEHWHFDKYFSAKNKVDIILNEVKKRNFESKISNQQIVFACKTALASGLEFMSISDSLNLIECGREFDSNGVVFDFFEAWLYLINGDFEKSEYLFKEILENKEESFLDFIKFNRRVDSQKRFFNKLFKQNSLINKNNLTFEKINSLIYV